MITTSPERRRSASGSTSRVFPPIKKTAAQPSLVKSSERHDHRERRDDTYDIDTKGDVAHTSDRSTCAMSVS